MRLNNIPAKHHEVALAWCKGEMIQIRNKQGHWGDNDDEYEPMFYESAEYRIKPKPVKKWFWAYTLKHTSNVQPLISVARFSQEQADSFDLWNDKQKIEFTEVEEEQ